MGSSITATKSITINATPERVWEALTTPEIIRQYKSGAEVVSDSRQQSGGKLGMILTAIKELLEK